MGEMIKVSVKRGTQGDDDQRMVSYEVPYEKGMTALMALEHLYQEHGVAYRHSCDIGMCTICMMHVNGKPQMVCKVILNEPMDLVFEPQRRHTLLRDLVTDWDSRTRS